MEERLPPEIVEKIFSYVDNKTLLSCPSVCRRWQKIYKGVVKYEENPTILRDVFQYFDHKTFMVSRQACKFWRNGLDELTAGGCIILKGRTTIAKENAEYLMENGDAKNNPFPSRRVYTSLVMKYQGGMEDRAHVVAEAEAIRKYGSHIQYLMIEILIKSVGVPISNILKNMTVMLSNVPNLQGLSIYINHGAGKKRHHSSQGVSSIASYLVALEKQYKIPAMNKLKAFRLMSWNFSSTATDWIFYKIMSQAPNLDLLDPDYCLDFSTFRTIFTCPTTYAFQLKCLKLTLSGAACAELHELLKLGAFPLEVVILDLFEYKYRRVLCNTFMQTMLEGYKKTLQKVAISFQMFTNPLPRVHREPSDFHTAISTSFKKKVPPNSDNSETVDLLKSLNLRSPAAGEDNYKLRILKLKGFAGSLDFLTKLKKLETFIMTDCVGRIQTNLDSQDAFFCAIPSLKDLHTKDFSNVEVDHIDKKLIDEAYSPLYY